MHGVNHRVDLMRHLIMHVDLMCNLMMSVACNADAFRASILPDQIEMSVMPLFSKPVYLQVGCWTLEQESCSDAQKLRSCWNAENQQIDSEMLYMPLFVQPMSLGGGLLFIPSTPANSSQEQASSPEVQSSNLSNIGRRRSVHHEVMHNQQHPCQAPRVRRRILIPNGLGPG